MCGRLTLQTPAGILAKHFGLALESLVPRYNAAPSQRLLALRVAEDGQREWAWLRWGLLPSWSKSADAKAPINARCETAASKPTFREALRQRRCLIPADGFYEWQTVAGHKQPFYMQLPGGEPFAFAGLWENWRGGREEIQSCTILTTAANSRLRKLHERMPVIVSPKDYAAWLSPATAAEALPHFWQSQLSESLGLQPVSGRVNSPAHDDPRCIEPATEQRTLFDE